MAFLRKEKKDEALYAVYDGGMDASFDDVWL
jgi:hypothetical protein